MCTSLKQALIFFAKHPVPGRVKTRLSPPLSPGGAAELYRCMLEDVLAKGVSLSGFDKRIYFEPDEGAASFFATLAPGMKCAPQKGADLGGRMAHAFGELFAEGYDRVAIIGTDLPDLPPANIGEAFERLADHDVDVVYGPSKDGGYYLIAMRELHGELFRDISWSSGEVLEQSLARAAATGLRVSLLPVWHDVDTIDDLVRPELLDEGNGALLTREFIKSYLNTSTS